jgi:hypothetical protein
MKLLIVGMANMAWAGEGGNGMGSAQRISRGAHAALAPGGRALLASAPQRRRWQPLAANCRGSSGGNENARRLGQNGFLFASADERTLRRM